VVLHDTRPDGRVLLTQEAFRGEMAVVSAGRAEQRNLTVLDLSAARDISRDGRSLLVTQFGSGSGNNYAVYLQGTDGSPAVRLGDGDATALSPDGAWALAIVRSPSSKLVLLPTGPGEKRVLPDGGLVHESAAWLPDGRAVLTCGTVASHPARCYVQDVASGTPRPVTGEGMHVDRARRPRVSPDGRSFVAVGPDGRLGLYQMAGGEPKPVPGIEPDEAAIEWSSDGASLLVHRPIGVPRRIFQVNVSTGARTLWREVAPSDPAGVLSNLEVLVTPDGKSYVAIFFRMLSSLYLVEGLR
jgi:Tol biopolymer transport system component